MKLASLKQGGRDGSLVIVSDDLSRALPATDVASTLQAALEDWSGTAPRLAERAAALNAGETASTIDFKGLLTAGEVHSPLPRAYQWADGSAYVTHVELVRKARGAELPPSFWQDPLMYQGGSDSFIGPRDPIRVADEGFGIDFEAEVAVVTTDVPMGISREAAPDYIALVMLVNDVTLRGLIPAELGKGFGFFHGKPSSAFSPVAVSPAALGPAWDGRKINLPLMSTLNGSLFGRPEAGVDMTFDFGDLIAHAAKTRPLAAGTIVGSGTVANKARIDGDASIGSSCIAEVRMIETIADGKPSTPFMRFGDTIRIEMKNSDGSDIFGAIDQKLVRYDGP